MTAREKAKMRRKWKRWLKKIIGEIQNLLVSQYIFQEIGKIVESNPKTPSPSLFNHWMINNYVSRMAVGIRRLTDKNPRTISLYNLIEDIADNPKAIGRDYFFHRYPERMRDGELATRDFQEFANKGQKFINPKGLRRDSKKLLRESKRIKDFVDKWIAHHDKDRASKVRHIPTFNEMDEALTLLDKTACKYHGLINGRHADTLLPGIYSDWRKPLRYAWIIDKSEE